MGRERGEVWRWGQDRDSRMIVNGAVGARGEKRKKGDRRL